VLSRNKTDAAKEIRNDHKDSTAMRNFLRKRGSYSPSGRAGEQPKEMRTNAEKKSSSSGRERERSSCWPLKGESPVIGRGSQRQLGPVMEIGPPPRAFSAVESLT